MTAFIRYCSSQIHHIFFTIIRCPLNALIGDLFEQIIFKSLENKNSNLF